MKKVIKKVVKQEEPKIICSCTNLTQDGGKTYCKDCGDVK